MNDATKALKDCKTVLEDEMQELPALLTPNTKAELKEERDKVIELENYIRRENLKFPNIPEAEEEGVHTPKQVILSILQKVLQIGTVKIRFHALHRIGN